MGSMNHNQPFVSLPFEVLEEIYVLSETLALSHVCQSFYISLSSRSTRLRFCTRLFYINNPRRDQCLRGDYLRGNQTKMLSQEWFTLEFAISLEKAVEHIRASDKLRNHVRSELAPTTRLDIDSNAQVLFTLFVSGVHLPSRLLCGPWSESKRNLLGQLYTWGLRMNPSDELKRYESMKGAIAEDNWEALRILLHVGPDLGPKGYIDLALSGRGSIVQKLLDLVGTENPVYWRVAGIPGWVRNHPKEELKKRRFC